jgi:ParB family chromosome partitioning protein
MEKKVRLGRGMDALFSDGPGSAEVPVEAIDGNPFQPRKEFKEGLDALCASIKTHGILQPLVVRIVGERYQLVAGERRLRAARSAGLTSVPVRIVDFNDQQVVEAALVENIHRTDLNPIEKAQGFKDYLDRFKMTHEQLAARLGLARETITNLLGLLNLPSKIQEYLRTGQLSQSHGKSLKGIPEPERQLQVAELVVTQGLSVRAAEALLKQAPTEAKPERASGGGGGGGDDSFPKTAHVQSLEDEIRQKLGVKVEIKQKAKDRGQIVLAFESNDDFERLVEALRR